MNGVAAGFLLAALTASCVIAVRAVEGSRQRWMRVWRVEHPEWFVEDANGRIRWRDDD